MAGIGESYLPAFVLALTSNQLACGLAASVPVVLGALLQLLAPWGLARCGSYRRWVVMCAVVQAATFALLLSIVPRGQLAAVVAYGVIAMYWATGFSGGTAWNAWVETLVPGRLRANYFAHRTRLAQIALLGGFIGGGLLLQFGARDAQSPAMFAVLFSVAAAVRLLAARFLATQSEPIPPAADQHLPGVGEFFAARGMSAALLYLLGLQMAVQMAGPYFTPYMLRQLQFSYGEYVTLMSATYVGKIVALPLLGRLAQRCGATGLLWCAALAVIPGAALWLVSEDFIYLLAIQGFSGAATASYELALLLLAFEVIPAGQRVSVLAVFNFANSTALLIGSLGGAVLLATLDQSREAYHLLFVISTGARVAALGILIAAPLATWLARLRTQPDCWPTTRYDHAPRMDRGADALVPFPQYRGEIAAQRAEQDAEANVVRRAA